MIEVAEEFSAKRTTETDQDITKTFFESIEVTCGQVDKIEEASRGQSESEVGKINLREE